MNKTLSTSTLRSKISDILDLTKKGNSFVIGKYDNPVAIIIPYPDIYNSKLSEITNLNAYSNSFDFLKDEPDLYTKKDIKFKYD